jgi:sugar O-acyltransferase (sialic acid O-acetyltransferase NeuD family)
MRKQTRHSKGSPIPMDLIIIGACGMGREVVDLARSLPQCGREWEIRGFLDSRSDLMNGLGDWPPIIGSPFEHVVGPRERFVCAVGDASYRLRFSELLCSKGGKFVTLMHPSAMVGSNTRIGEGCILYAGAGIGPNVTLGDFVFLNSFAGVGHDSSVGDGTTVGPMTCVGGGARIGRGVYIGSNATILPQAVLEDFCFVGAGSVVLRRVKARTKVFGNPAVPIGTVSTSVTIEGRSF